MTQDNQHNEMPKDIVEEQLAELNEDFMDIIKRYAPASYAHLIDNDDNDGENFRRSMREELTTAYKKGVEDENKRLKAAIGADGHIATQG